jgi:hypothetical protein
VPTATFETKYIVGSVEKLKFEQAKPEKYARWMLSQSETKRKQ